MFIPIPDVLAMARLARNWLWETVLLPGHVTLLAGEPKLGKTSVVVGLIHALTAGHTIYLGRGLKPGPAPVYYLTEEPAGVWAARVRSGLLQQEAPLYLLFRSPDLSWPATLELLSKVPPTSILVIDTLSAWWNVANENDASQVHAALAPVIMLTREKGLATMVLHHLRKPSPDISGLSRVRGSSVLVAESDIVALLIRDKQRLAIQVLSRYSDEDLLYVPRRSPLALDME